MYIKDLKLVNFRNYETLKMKFHPSLNIYIGNNGVGKTNLVEAIYVLALTRSFRQSNDKHLITKDKQLSKIEGNIINTYENNYQILISGEGKKVKIDQNKVTKISNYISRINIILFHPSDLRIIKDTPNLRRKSLNIDISQLKISYLKNLNHYNKLLKQRNVYLKQKNTKDNVFLNVLTEKLVDYGLEIFEERKQFISMLNQYVPKIYQNIAVKGKLQIHYTSDYLNKSKEQLLAEYNKGLERDLFNGKTKLGIHADDFSFVLDDNDLKNFGSEGQQKNAIISLKFAELEIFKSEKGYYPILILDDIFSELDKEKITHILAMLKPEIQTFITSANMEHLNFEVLKHYQLVKIDESHNLEVKLYE